MKRMISPSDCDDLVEDGFQAIFELAAIFGARDERTHVERDDLLVLQALGHILVDDATRQPLDNSRLADARLADQHRIVLRAAREHLNDATNLFVAADDGIELAATRQLGQVAPVLLERLVLGFRILIGHALRTAHLRQDFEDSIFRDVVLLKQRVQTDFCRLPTTIPSSRCSVLTKSSFRRVASACAASVTLRRRGESDGCDPP